LTGAPATGDQFTVAAAGTASVFSTLSGLVSTLTSTTLNSAQLTTQIGTALQQLQGAVAHMGDVQASVGSRVNVITSAQSSAQTQQTNLQSSVSSLQDVDYAAAVTQLNTEEVSLQAAQESYASLAKLSLFNYLS
jgi:flagellar hook-associated protein 3 FlgL